MSPIHYAIGENFQSGTAYLNATKTHKITFEKPFSKKPNIQVTLGDQGTAPLYKVSVTTTGFTIRCQVPWTGEADWTATERNGG